MMMKHGTRGRQGGGARTGLLPTRAETRLFVDELARRGLYERRQAGPEEVADWQILDEVPVDAGFSREEVAWFVTGEGEAAMPADPPRPFVRLRALVAGVLAQARPA